MEIKKSMWLLAGLVGVSAVAVAHPGKAHFKKKRIEKLMAHDANQDGALSEAELREGLKSLAERRHKRFDLNGDGEVTHEERKTIHQKRHEARDERHRLRAETHNDRRHRGKNRRGKRMLERLDQNKDGKVSLSEARAFSELRAKRMMRRKDVNQNGQLERSELMAHRRKHGPQAD